VLAYNGYSHFSSIKRKLSCSGEDVNCLLQYWFGKNLRVRENTSHTLFKNYAHEKKQ